MPFSGTSFPTTSGRSDVAARRPRSGPGCHCESFRGCDPSESSWYRRGGLLCGQHTVAGGATALRDARLDRDRQRGGGEALLAGQPDRVAVACEVLRIAVGRERVADARHVVETAEALTGALDRHEAP